MEEEEENEWAVNLNCWLLYIWAISQVSIDPPGPILEQLKKKATFFLVLFHLLSFSLRIQASAYESLSHFFFYNNTTLL